MMQAHNLLIIMDDEHNKKVLGYNGHPVVQTPHLDRLAAGGTVYDNAYSCSPICVPARAAFATGPRQPLLGQCHRLRRPHAELGACIAGRRSPGDIDRQTALHQ